MKTIDQVVRRLFLLAIVAGLAAQAPRAFGEGLKACVNNNSGTIHVMVSSRVCGSNETEVTLGGGGALSGYQIVAKQVLLSGGQATNVRADCPSGKKVLGGGYDIETPDFVKVFSSEPSDGAGNVSEHSWNVFARNDDSHARQVTVLAICAVFN